MKADEDLSNTEYPIFYPTMNNPMIYDGGKLFPCDATQSRFSDNATVAAVINLLMEEPDIAYAPTEDQEKKEKTATEGNDMTSADSANAMDPNDKKEAEKEAEENQTDEKGKQETSETTEKREELEGSKEPEKSKDSTEPEEQVELNIAEV